ncbi:MAG: chorismate mutase [Lachnospiraceae bacterium]|nr:chorismate mutase [Lachnospiraceae bacterium]
MIDLKDSRAEIDRIDQQIVALFERRMQVAADVAEYKKSVGKPVFDKAREEEKLLAVKNLCADEFNGQAVREVFKQIMSISRRLQYTLNQEPLNGGFKVLSSLPRDAETKVVFFGAPGSYSEQAMEECFGEEITSFPAATFKEVMEAVRDGLADFGVLPIENTTTGGITDSYDLMVDFDNYIVGEHVLRINQALLGLDGAKVDGIRTVYSHAQGILQSREFLKSHPMIQAIESGSTAGAACLVAKEGDPTKAAIASVRAAKKYGLRVLADQINSEEGNSTRFIIITGRKEHLCTADRVAICFSLPHETGSLYNMLSNIIYNGLNMTKIESRPLPGRNFEYRFFVDFEGTLTQAAVQDTLSCIRKEALDMKLLGNYCTV